MDPYKYSCTSTQRLRSNVCKGSVKINTVINANDQFITLARVKEQRIQTLTFLTDKRNVLLFRFINLYFKIAHYMA